MKLSELKRRLELVERELTELREKIAVPNGHWWVDQAGRFAGDKEFQKIIKYGRQYRKSLDAKANT